MQSQQLPCCAISSLLAFELLGLLYMINATQMGGEGPANGCGVLGDPHAFPQLFGITPSLSPSCLQTTAGNESEKQFLSFI